MASQNPNRASLRQSIAPPSMTSSKPRQYAHLQSQLAQLQANLSDLEELLHMTTTQAENIKILGGLQGGFFMAASKVFEESDQARAEKEQEGGESHPR